MLKLLPKLAVMTVTIVVVVMTVVVVVNIALVAATDVIGVVMLL